ncbi:MULTISPECIES: hypothetical protein [Novosphingobium]|uniref:hypothetical protein n=1 Tax=Novosphingobium TaxID=165696 RepID=UPI00137523F1|nr:MULTISPECIES: hypothetical protein [Novosphingobium]
MVIDRFRSFIEEGTAFKTVPTCSILCLGRHASAATACNFGQSGGFDRFGPIASGLE